MKGTHAHSWIMAFDEEEDSFEAYAEVMPKNCIFLIDTYDTIEGVKKAIAVAKKMRKKGIEMIGVRLDSGDLAHFSIEVRKLLDEGGFPQAKIMASNELDEYIINDLKHQGAKITIWGVGTNLVTAKISRPSTAFINSPPSKMKRENGNTKSKSPNSSSKSPIPAYRKYAGIYDERGQYRRHDLRHSNHTCLLAPLYHRSF